MLYDKKKKNKKKIIYLAKERHSCYKRQTVE